MSGMDKSADIRHNGYEDMMDLARPISKKHPPMPREKRAAQFAPFQAMVGYDEAVGEAARVTKQRAELDPDRVAILDGRLQSVRARLGEQPKVQITYFQKDDKKDGGEYCTISGCVKKIKEAEQILVFTSGEEVAIQDIYDIET